MHIFSLQEIKKFSKMFKIWRPSFSISFEDIKFDFKKIGKHEFAIANKLCDQLVKTQKELPRSQYIKDLEFLTLK